MWEAGCMVSRSRTVNEPGASRLWRRSRMSPTNPIQRLSPFSLGNGYRMIVSFEYEVNLEYANELTGSTWTTLSSSDGLLLLYPVPRTYTCETVWITSSPSRQAMPTRAGSPIGGKGACQLVMVLASVGCVDVACARSSIDRISPEYCGKGCSCMVKMSSLRNKRAILNVLMVWPRANVSARIVERLRAASGRCVVATHVSAASRASRKLSPSPVRDPIGISCNGCLLSVRTTSWIFTNNERAEVRVNIAGGKW